MINFEWNDDLKDPLAPPEISVPMDSGNIVLEDDNGTLRHGYLNEHGEFICHREDGPAIIYESGTKQWFFNGLYHRLDGPAIIHFDGLEEWYQNNIRHRLDGPAASLSDGREVWFFNGLLHRVDGPARIYPDGMDRQWFLYGIKQKSECEYLGRHPFS